MPWPAWTAPLAAFACPFLISLLGTALLLRWAPRLRLVDVPDARKVHTTPTPRAGGLAIFAGVVLGALLIPGIVTPPLGRVLALGLGVVLLGLADDLWSLPWQSRLAVQFLLTGAALYLRAEPLAWELQALALVGVVALVNAFNMLDNMDALSAGVAWIAAAFLAVTLVLRPEGGFGAALPYLLLMGALSGFLWFNRPPARIFMGDAGSTFLGFYLGLGALDVGLGPSPPGPWTWAAPVAVLAVPWYDMTAVVLLRLKQGHSPFHPDKQHVSHRLVNLGLSSPLAVRVLYLFGIASGLTGLALDSAPGMTGALTLGQLAVVWAALAGIEYLPYWRKR